MEDNNVVHHQLLNSQVKYLALINSLFDSSEAEFKLRFDAFLKERFTHWLKVGKKILSAGFTQPAAFNNRCTINFDVFNEY